MNRMYTEKIHIIWKKTLFLVLVYFILIIR